MFFFDVFLASGGFFRFQFVKVKRGHNDGYRVIAVRKLRDLGGETLVFSGLGFLPLE